MQGDLVIIIIIIFYKQFPFVSKPVNDLYKVLKISLLLNFSDMDAVQHLVTLKSTLHMLHLRTHLCVHTGMDSQSN